jgi:hypothetical protein
MMEANKSIWSTERHEGGAAGRWENGRDGSPEAEAVRTLRGGLSPRLSGPTRRAGKDPGRSEVKMTDQMARLGRMVDEALSEAGAMPAGTKLS